MRPDRRQVLLVPHHVGGDTDLFGQFTPGRANVWGTLLAVYVLATGVQRLQFVTGVLWLNSMFNGVALIAAVSFAVWRQGRTTKVRQLPEVEEPPQHRAAPAEVQAAAPSSLG